MVALPGPLIARDSLGVPQEVPPVYDALAAPVTSLVAITPNDSADIPAGCRALWIGGFGNLSVVAEDDVAPPVVIAGIAAGTLLPIRAKRIYVATTATLIVGLY